MLNFKRKILKPKQFTHTIKVLAEHIDELEHVNNVVYLEYLQATATTHWYATAPRYIYENVRWVVRKHEIEYLKSAKLGDELQISTWVEHFTAISSLRKYRITLGSDLIVTAETLWICLDAQTMKPKRLEKEVTDLFFE